jgi:ferredoxin
MHNDGHLMQNDGHRPQPDYNAPGKYFVSETCDGCAYCASVAPENFDFDKVTNTYFVSKQPATPEEQEFVREAQEDCPIDAIRSQD